MNSPKMQPVRGSVDAETPAEAWLADLAGMVDSDPLSSVGSVPGRSALVGLAYEEYCRRREAGEAIDPDDFCAAHADVRSSLGRLLRVHGFLEQQQTISWPAPDEEFLGFHLVRELGRGAFARVYFAREIALGNRPVALKVSRGESREGHTLGRLSHPHIVQVHSAPYDATRDLTAVCMPYLGSATLCDVLDACSQPRPTAALAILDALTSRGPSESLVAAEVPDRVMQKGSYVDGVLRIGAQLASALQFIHDRKIFHRDLKPSNVLMTPAARPMLIDFNLCEDKEVANNRLGGTLPYMAPEHLRAISPERCEEPALLDASTDIFALGVMLYELLTGVHPFGDLPLKLTKEEAIPLLLERQKTRPRPLREMLPALDADLAALIDSCLAYEQKDRPQDAGVLATQLGRSRSPLARVQRRLGQHPWLTAAMVLLTLGISVAAAWLQGVPPIQQPPQPAAVIQALPQGEPALLLLPESRRHRVVKLHAEYAAVLVRANQAYGEKHYHEALALLDTWIKFNPNDAEGVRARARTYLQLGASETRYYNIAAGEYHRLHQLQPDGSALASIAYCELRSEFSASKAAIRWGEMALEHGYATAEVYNNLAFCCINQPDQIHLVDHYLDMALLLKPDLQAALHNRAVWQFRLALDADTLRGPRGKHPLYAQRRYGAQYRQYLYQSREDFREALKGPHNVELLRDAGWAWSKTAEFQGDDVVEVMQLFAEAIALGYDPATLRNDFFLKRVLNRRHFAALLEPRATARKMPPTSRLVDPG